LKIQGVSHTTFNEIILFSPLFRCFPMFFGSLAPQRAQSLIRAYTLAFFDKQLRNQISPLLTGPSPEYPQAIRIKMP
jgi:hypothetical protein